MKSLVEEGLVDEILGQLKSGKEEGKTRNGI